MEEKFMRISALVLLVLGWLIPALGQGGADFQVRIPLHLQAAKGNKKIGFAGWFVLPDTTAHGNRFASLVVAGALYRYDKRGSWIEFMGGARFNENGYKDPLVNIRFLDSTLKRFNFFGDIGCFPRESRKRFYWFLSADTPVQVRKFKFRVGVESENIHFPGRRDSLGLGPRTVVPLPLKLPQSLKLSVVTAYQFRSDRDFLRLYATLLYRPNVDK